MSPCDFSNLLLLLQAPRPDLCLPSVWNFASFSSIRFFSSLSRRPKEGKPKETRGGETVRYTTVWPLLQPRGQPRGDSLFTECKSGFIWWLCVHRPRRGFLRSRSVRMDPPFTSVAERPLVCRLCRARESRMYVYIRDLRIPTDKKEPIAQGDFIGQSVSRAIGRASLDDAVTGVGAAVGARHSPPLPSSFFLSFLSFRRFLPSPSILQLSSFYFIPHIFDDDDDLRRKRISTSSFPLFFPPPPCFRLYICNSFFSSYSFIREEILFRDECL